MKIRQVLRDRMNCCSVYPGDFPKVNKRHTFAVCCFSAFPGFDIVFAVCFHIFTFLVGQIGIFDQQTDHPSVFICRDVWSFL